MKPRFKCNRIKLLRMLALVLFLVVFGRVGYLQAIASDDLGRKAVESRTMDRKLEPTRGNIYDATGKVFASNVETRTVYAEPPNYKAAAVKLQGDAAKTQELERKLKTLADMLELKLTDIQTKLNSPKQWVSLARQVDTVKAEAIKKLDIPGVGFSIDTKRVYPMGNAAASILGVVDVDGQGLEGLELAYNDLLYGEKGSVSEETDAMDRSVPGGLHFYQAPRDGDNLVLTLDSNIQHFVEQQLDEIMAAREPTSATIVAMDPRNGKILAMGSRPSFNPNDFSKFVGPLPRNLAVTTQYEPGSTFKVITAAAALEEGTTAVNKVYRDPGYLVVDRQRITNWDSGLKAPGNITFKQGLEQSSNVVFGQVGLELARDVFFKYIRGFGFGRKTGIDLPGEAPGTLLQEQVTHRFEQASMSFGQVNAVSPLQLITAVSAVANGGTLYKPYVVDKITDNQGNLVKQVQPQVQRQVISRTTAEQLKSVLESVVNNGTGEKAKIAGYRVAGKTGTAQKVDETGQYSDKDFISSFVGFAPADDPRIALLVIVDSPHKGGFHGSDVAAPPFRAIVQQTLTYLDVPPSSQGVSQLEEGQKDSNSRSQEREPVVPERQPGPGEGVVPDLKGRTMGEVGELLSKQGLRMNFVGSGLAVSQNYPPGKVLAAGTVVTVNFEP